MNKPRFCYWIDETQDTSAYGGYVPSLVAEDEEGHRPMIGDPKVLQAPWVWGTTLAVAKETCAKLNAEMGLSAKDVAVIVASSMRAGNAGRIVR